eukprot:710356-Pyramimonas_sp.AAC.2
MSRARGGTTPPGGPPLAPRAGGPWWWWCRFPLFLHTVLGSPRLDVWWFSLRPLRKPHVRWRAGVGRRPASV